MIHVAIESTWRWYRGDERDGKEGHRDDRVKELSTRRGMREIEERNRAQKSLLSDPGYHGYMQR
jgi:hypothetical protein